MLKKLLGFVCLGVFLSSLGSAYAQDTAAPGNDRALPSIKVSMFLKHEGFLMWYAKKMGYDRKLGIDIQLEIVNTNGIEEMRRRHDNHEAWDVTAVSSIPFLVGSQNMELEIIGIANDESPCTSVMVKGDSDILSVQGANNEYPNVYGNADTIKGKNFLIKGTSTGLYTLASYLDIFDLSLSQVVINDLHDESIMEELKKHKADGAGLWSPDTYLAEQEGYKFAATAEDLGENLPIMFIIDKHVAKAKGEVVSKMLAAYNMVINQQLANPNSLVDDYQEFLKIYTKRDFPSQLCEYDINHHLIYNLDTQLNMLTKQDNKSSRLHKIKRSIGTQLMLILKEMPNSEALSVTNVLKNEDYINAKYLNSAKKHLDFLTKNQ